MIKSVWVESPLQVQIVPMKWIHVFSASPQGVAEFRMYLAKLRGNKHQDLTVTLLALQTQRRVVQLFYDYLLFTSLSMKTCCYCSISRSFTLIIAFILKTYL